MKYLIEEATLTGIADAIRGKKGTSDLIQVSNLATEIANIQGGGEATMKTVEGTLPLTVEGVGQRLEDYKIYGAEGGVGDQTANLFDKHYDVSYGGSAPNIRPNTNGLSTEWYAVADIGTDFTFALNPKEAITSIVVGYIYSDDKTTIKGLAGVENAGSFTVNADNFRNFSLNATADGSNYVKFFIANASKVNDMRIYKGYSNKSTEPYGFYYPIKVNGTEYKLLLGYNLNDGDYIDYENRMVVSDGTSTLIELPEIHLADGINIIDVDTTVKPSKMSVSFVDNGSKYKHIHGTGEIDIHNSMCNQCLENAQFSNLSGEYAYTWNQLNDNGNISTSSAQNGVTFTNIGNGKLALSGTATARAMMPVVSASFISTWDTSHKYYLRQLYPGSSSSTVFWHTFNSSVKSAIILGSNMNFTANYPRVAVAQNFDATGIEIIPQIFDLTMMFGAGNEPTMEQFEAMFPDIYEYDSGTSYSKFSITIADKKQDFVYKTALSEYMPETPIIIPKGNSKIILNDATIDGDYYSSV